MKINIQKSFIEFIPDNNEETEKIEELWKTIVDCVKFNKKLVPIGEYVPAKQNIARFAIED